MVAQNSHEKSINLIPPISNCEECGCDIVWCDLVDKLIKYLNLQTNIQLVVGANSHSISNDQIRFPKCILLDFPEF